MVQQIIFLTEPFKSAETVLSQCVLFTKVARGPQMELYGQAG